MNGLSLSSLVLPVLLACFGPLVAGQNCPYPDPLDHSVLFPDQTNCSRYFICSNGKPIQQNCPAGLYFNDHWKVCDHAYNVNCVPQCSPLPKDDGGYWSPATCSSGFNKQGATCKLECDQDHVLRGSASVQCTESGWNSSNGNFIPRCEPVECIGEDLEDDLNKTLSVKAGLLFVLDESGSVSRKDFELTKDFVRNIVQKFPLSDDRSAGVITFDSSALLQIHLNENSTSRFITKLNSIPYRGGGTDILNALRAAINEIKTYKVHPLTLVFIITDGVSVTDGTPAADEIKKDNNPIFAIGINQNNLVHLESLASTGDNGIRHFFHVRTYEVLDSIGKYINPPAGSGGSNNSTQCKNK